MIIHECEPLSKGEALMDYIRGTARNQVMLLPEAVEDYITEDNPVRFIDAFVASLDLAALGFTHATPAETGRPAYDPGDLLRLYLYG
jgi:transposase